MNQRPADRLELTMRDIPTFLGIYPRERQQSQLVDVAITFSVHVQRCAASGELSQSVDYSRAYGAVRALLWNGRFRLLETAVETIAGFLLSEFPNHDPSEVCHRVQVRVNKKQALGEGAEITLCVSRDRETAQLENPDCRAHLLKLAPGERRTGPWLRTLLLALEPGLLLPEEKEVIPGQLLLGHHLRSDLASTPHAGSKWLAVECLDEEWSAEAMVPPWSRVYPT